MVRSKILKELIARWGRLSRGMTLGVRVAAIDGGGRVMLVRHGYAPGWHLPGGAVDVGESARAAAIRELEEETGVIAEGEPRLVGVHFNPAFGGRDHVVVYAVERFRRGPEPAPNREIAERGWFAPGGLPEGVTPATLRRLAEVSGKAAPTGVW